MIENPITKSMIESGLRSGAITVENDCGELVAHIGDGYILCGDVEGDGVPDESSMTGKIFDVLCGFAEDEAPDNGFADELNYYSAYLSEVVIADVLAEFLDNLMEQKCEVADGNELGEELDVLNEDR